MLGQACHLYNVTVFTFSRDCLFIKNFLGQFEIRRFEFVSIKFVRFLQFAITFRNNGDNYVSLLVHCASCCANVRKYIDRQFSDAFSLNVL